MQTALTVSLPHFLNSGSGRNLDVVFFIILVIFLSFTSLMCEFIRLYDILFPKNDFNFLLMFLSNDKRSDEIARHRHNSGCRG